MDGSQSLLIFGASARAAAFSALRAGFRPWCADLFADADLHRRVPAMQLPGRYPDGFLDLIDVELPGPWMYTGGLENRPFLVAKMARRRPLLGNDQAALLSARSPFTLAQILVKARLPGPAVWGPGDRFPPRGHHWLIKPLAGSGGAGIRYLDDESGNAKLQPDRCYVQEFVEGDSRAAVFVGDGRAACLLGVTRQLVGKAWLNAAAFHYCGSIGPLPLTATEQASLERPGAAVASGCGLRGLFGVDGIWRRGALWPVEVNPRYTASVEVLEYATGLRSLALHEQVFAKGGLPAQPARVANGVVGKAVVFARGRLNFPATGPWLAALDTPIDELPAYADIPPPGTPIKPGQPVLTVFARANTVDACENGLREIAARVDRDLFGARDNR
jgi:predicted ATP-grasp superfamily ATP-dependent carboligase